MNFRKKFLSNISLRNFLPEIVQKSFFKYIDNKEVKKPSFNKEWDDYLKNLYSPGNNQLAKQGFDLKKFGYYLA